jgi:hypothetical protein
MGASDFTSGDFKNKTRPILKKLETSSKTVESQLEKEKEKINYSSTNSHSLIVFFSDWVRDFLCSNNTEL